MSEKTELSELHVMNHQIITKTHHLSKTSGGLWIPESMNLNQSGYVPILEVVAFDPKIKKGHIVREDGAIVEVDQWPELEVGSFIVVQNHTNLLEFIYPVTSNKYYHVDMHNVLAIISKPVATEGTTDGDSSSDGDQGNNL